MIRIDTLEQNNTNSWQQARLISFPTHHFLSLSQFLSSSFSLNFFSLFLSNWNWRIKLVAIKIEAQSWKNLAVWKKWRMNSGKEKATNRFPNSDKTGKFFFLSLPVLSLLCSVSPLFSLSFSIIFFVSKILFPPSHTSDIFALFHPAIKFLSSLFVTISGIAFLVPFFLLLPDFLSPKISTFWLWKMSIFSLSRSINIFCGQKYFSWFLGYQKHFFFWKNEAIFFWLVINFFWSFHLLTTCFLLFCFHFCSSFATMILIH